VRHAWRLTRWWKSTVGVCSYQPLAKSKGVHSDVESEGSWKAKFRPKEHKYHQAYDVWMSLQYKMKSNNYTDILV